ncbi:hypothetical protein K7472_27040 [Streptomyces sp. PTM05]|uniref:Lipoprotein n=1 Tax=Streptantibioticus parmotrematis TaxID=2873249 RepID=A0ABS7QZ26_9ACTN|nr:hypothetical protein [Streptantibioticus parmotrematis]MBY8888470.1 hypothetical protein [Streptantibioticus parmotrematis]
MVTLAAVALTGCSGGTAALPRPQSSALPQAHVDLISGISLPLEKFMSTSAQDQVIARGRHRLETTCLRRFGVPATATESAEGPPDAANLPSRYGVSSLAQAERYGYHYTYPTEAAPARLSEDQYTVLTGHLRPSSSTGTPVVEHSWHGRALPDGGCYGEATRSLFDGAPPDMQQVEQLDAHSFFQAEDTPGVKGVISAWSACMRRRGYQVASPLSKQLAPAPGPKPSTDEVDTAVADVECKRSTQLISVWAQAERRIQAMQVRQYQQELESAYRAYSAAVARAADVR